MNPARMAPSAIWKADGGGGGTLGGFSKLSSTAGFAFSLMFLDILVPVDQNCWEQSKICLSQLNLSAISSHEIWPSVQAVASPHLIGQGQAVALHLESPWISKCWRSWETNWSASIQAQAPALQSTLSTNKALEQEFWINGAVIERQLMCTSQRLDHWAFFPLVTGIFP